MSYLFAPPPPPTLPILDSDQVFPIRRVFCVGRNYAAHAAEMGNEVDREAPFYFLKSAHHVLFADGGEVPVPPRTENYHHEIELVAALDKGGSGIAVADALDHVLGYAVGLDMTRRDLQQDSKDKRRSWDTSKDFEFSGLCSALCPPGKEARPDQGAITLHVNGTLRQSGDLADQVWSLAEIIADLSTLYQLEAGDVIFTGTPSGVGPVVAGDALLGAIEGIGTLNVRLR